MASYNFIKMSLIYFNFQKGLLIKSCRSYMPIAVILLSSGKWNMKTFALQKYILHVLYVNTKH